MSVITAKDSAPGHYTDLISVSLEPVWPGEGPELKNFMKSDRITEKTLRH